MFTLHPEFIQPANEDIKIWRHLDFTKLLSLIDSRQLYFSRADKFDDPFEGSWPRLNVEARKYIPESISDEVGRNKYEAAVNTLPEIFKNWRRCIAINCWHANEHESVAMWKLYLKSNEGIAIQSTYKKFKNCILDAENVYIGKVKYIDYEIDVINANNILSPFNHKRKSFEHEKEIRGLIIRWPKEEPFSFTKDTIDDGLTISVNLEMLIEKIYISPYAPARFKDLVGGVIKRYGYGFEIVQSELNKDPLF